MDALLDTAQCPPPAARFDATGAARPCPMHQRDKQDASGSIASQMRTAFASMTSHHTPIHEDQQNI
jgi:hypothetical protein